MNKLRKYIKTEMDVEFFSCAHSVSMIFIYSFLLWIESKQAITFIVIIEMMILGYVMAWIQKGLFLKEKVYGRTEYILREILWNVLPILSMPIAGKLCSWFAETASWVEVTFYIIMAIYVVMIWGFLRVFHDEETKELNQLLQRKRKKKENAENSKEGM